MSVYSVIHDFILRDKVSDQLEKIAKNSKAATDKIGDNLNGVDKKTDQIGKSLGGLGISFKRLAGIATGAFAGISIAGFVTDAVASAEHLKTLETGFAAVTKSADKAKALTGLRDELAKLPVPLQETDKAMNRLVGAGVHGAAQMRQELTKLAAVSVGAHASIDDLGLIYERVKMGGNLQGEQMAQMIDRGIPIAHALAEVKGVTEDKIKKMISKGEISFNDFNTALDHMTTGSGVYSTILDDMAKNTEGKAAIISNKAKLISEDFGKAFLPARAAFQDFQSKVLDKIKPYLDNIAKAITWVTQNFDSLLMVVAPLTAGFIGYTIAVKAQAIAMRISAIATALMTGGMKGLNAAMKVNPVGLVVAGIMALATVITMAWQRSEKFRGIVLGVWEVMKGFASALGNMFKSPWETIKGIFNGISSYVKNLIAPLMETIDHVKNGRWLEAAKSSGKFLLNLTPVGAAMTAVDMVKESGVLDSVASSFAEGYAKGKSKEDNKEEEKTTDTPEHTTSGGGGHSPDLTRKTGDGSSTGTAKNIVLNINSLIGEFTVNSNGVKQSYEEIKTMVTRAIFDGVRDSELSFG